MAVDQPDRSTMIGVFADLRLAQEAVSELKQAGFTDDQIGVIHRGPDGDAEGLSNAHEDAGSKAAEGAVTGMAAGASVGALWAIGIAAGMLPAVGPVIAGGLLASVLASAVGSAAVAGLVGALVALGVPEHEAKYYEDELRSGRTIVMVNSNGRHDQITTIFEQYGAYDMKGRHTHSATAMGGTAREPAQATRTPAARPASGSEVPLGTAGAVAIDALAEERRLDEARTQQESAEDISRKRPR